ncbi:MAG: ATP synthase F1 subunit gamma [Candidatus Doudnabacteria bacterium]|nr:ATP synthase F1 subunit gamma [Candidatus Doudnabacteria bacterium]
MPQSTREIRRRIKSVKNIGQITKAMELVSASKMRKAQSAAASSRPYSQLSSELLTNLLQKVSLHYHPLLKRVVPEYGKIIPKHKALIILISSDKGLAGSLNTNVIGKALKIAKEEKADQVDFLTLGKKASEVVRRSGYNLVAVFPGKDRNITVFDAKPIAKIAVDDFLNFTYDKVYVVYTNFISTLVQKPNMLQLLPLTERSDNHTLDEYEFEPNRDEVLENIIYRHIEFALYQSLQEAAASEHSARMVAMKNANQAAGDLIEDLTLSANQARQAGITRELSEISAAKIAMEG